MGLARNDKGYHLKKSFKNLREFVHALEEAGELIRIRREVSRDLEITEITDRVSKMPGPAGSVPITTATSIFWPRRFRFSE